MSTARTAWHPAFTLLLRERAPRWVEVRAEVQLTAEPLRVDDLLTLHARRARDPHDEGHGLGGLWRHLREVMLLEFKSRAREFRRGDLHRLIAYGALWCAAHGVATSDVTLVLAVPRVNDALRGELDDCGFTLERREDGYHEARGSYLALIVADLSQIAEREGDDVLRWFAREGALSLAARRWLRQHLNTGSETMTVQITPDLEGYDVFIAELLAAATPEQRVAGLTPEQRVAGLAPEERLVGLSPEERLLVLPDTVLRALDPDYVASLPESVRRAIRERLAR